MSLQRLLLWFFMGSAIVAIAVFVTTNPDLLVGERLALLYIEAQAQASATQAYSVHDIHSVMAEEIVTRGATPGGLTWYYARPPVEGLDFEMDVRGVPVERVLAP